MTEQVLQNGRVVFRNVATGQIGSVAAEDVERFSRNPDYRPVGAAEYAEAQQIARDQTLGGKAKAFAGGAAQAVGDVAGLIGRPVARAAFGAANAVSGAFGGEQISPTAVDDVLGRDVASLAAGAISSGATPDKLAAADAYQQRVQQLREANPGAFGAGELAGNVGLGMLTGGVSAAAGKGLAQGIAGLGARGAVADAAGMGLAMGAEGGFYGAAQAEGEARRAGQSDGATAEQLLQGIGLGALLGGGIGAGLGAGGSAFRKLMDTVDNRIASRATSAITETEAAGLRVEKSSLANVYNELASATSGAEKSTLEKYGLLASGPEAVEGRALWRARDELVDKASTEMTSALQKLDDAVETITERVRNSKLKAAGVDAQVAESGVSPASLKSTAKTEINSGIASIQQMHDALPVNEYTKHVRADLKRAMDFGASSLSELEKGAGGGSSFVAVDGFKRELQRVKMSLDDTANFSQSGLAKRYARDASAKFETEIQEPIRQSLEDASKWGKHAAESQREINANFHRMFGTKGRYRNELFTRGERDYATGLRENIAESGKVKSWVSRIGTTEGATGEGIVRDHLDAAQSLIDTIGKHYDLTEAEAAILRQAQEASASLKTTLAKVDKTARVANEINSVFAAQKSGMGTAVGAGGVVGGLVGGLPGAALGTAAGMVLNPGAGIALRQSLEATASRFGVKLDRGIGDWIRHGSGLVSGAARVAKGTAKTVAKAAVETADVARKVAVPTAVNLFVGRHSDIESAYDSRINQLIRARQDPGLLLANMARVAGGLPDVSPEVATILQGKARNAVEFLASKAPAGTIDPTPLDPGRKSIVPKLDMMRFARVWAAVEKPETVVADLRKGSATPDQIEALRTVHPETYEAIRMAAMNAVLDVSAKGKRIPLAMRQQLDMLLDLGGAGEPALSPEVADRIGKFRDARQDKQKQASTRKAPDLASAAALPQDRWMKG